MNEATTKNNAFKSMDGLPTRPDELFSVSWKNLRIIQPEWLRDQHVLHILKLFVLDVSDSGDPADAGQLFFTLYELLGRLPRFVEQEPEIYREYLRMLAVLKASFLITMPDTDIFKFLQENLLFALEVPDFPIEDKINELLVLHKDFEDGAAGYAKKLTAAMDGNIEPLGMSRITILGQSGEQIPSVGNWLKVYNFFSRPKPGLAAKEIGRSAVDRVGFLTQNSNARKLSADERAILIRLFELYDWLRYGQQSVFARINRVPVVPAPPVSASRQ